MSIALSPIPSQLRRPLSIRMLLYMLSYTHWDVPVSRSTSMLQHKPYRPDMRLKETTLPHPHTRQRKPLAPVTIRSAYIKYI